MINKWLVHREVPSPNWNERKRDTQQVLPGLQAQLDKIDGQNVFAFPLPSLPGSTGGLPVQMVTAPNAPSDLKETK